MNRRVRRLVSMLSTVRPRAWRRAWTAVAAGYDAHGEPVREQYDWPGFPARTPCRAATRPVMAGTVSFARLTGFYVTTLTPAP